MLFSYSLCILSSVTSLYHFLYPTMHSNAARILYLVAAFSCALVSDILLQGRLYVTSHHFAFYSNLFGHVTRVRLTSGTFQAHFRHISGTLQAHFRHISGSLHFRHTSGTVQTHFSYTSDSQLCDVTPTGMARFLESWAPCSADGMLSTYGPLTCCRGKSRLRELPQSVLALLRTVAGWP